MNNQKTPVLAKSSASGGSYAEPQEKSFNAATMAAIQEARDIMSGKKKVKWNTPTTKEELKAQLEKMVNEV